MLFSSVTFLFIFLPIVVCGYYILPKRFRNFYLLVASILFYAFGEPKFLILMLITIFTNYIGTLLLYNFEKFKKLFLVTTVLIDLGLLCYFKYFNFLIYCINEIFRTRFDILHIALPLGISFYIFQAISYTADVYKGIIKPEKNLYKFALYITLFPQLIAGPILRYSDLSEQIDNRKETLEQFYYGLRRFIIGLARKVLIADCLMLVVNRVLESAISDITIWEVWLALICFLFQLYNDFGGYTDMAVGLGAMFGFKIKENFNFPLLSQSYTEFWRRWHITLGLWVKDYIYIPLGGNRCSKLKHYFNLFIAFFVIGIWHGANFNMIVYGLYNAFVAILEKVTGWSNKVTSKRMIALHHIYMFFVLTTSCFLLRAPNFKYAIEFYKRTIGIGQPKFPIYTIEYYITNVEIIVLIIAFLGAIGLFKNILNYSRKNIVYNSVMDFCLVILLVLSVSAIAISSYTPFLYFGF